MLSGYPADQVPIVHRASGRPLDVSSKTLYHMHIDDHGEGPLVLVAEAQRPSTRVIHEALCCSSCLKKLMRYMNPLFLSNFEMRLCTILDHHTLHCSYCILHISSLPAFEFTPCQTIRREPTRRLSHLVLRILTPLRCYKPLEKPASANEQLPLLGERRRKPRRRKQVCHCPPSRADTDSRTETKK